MRNLLVFSAIILAGSLRITWGQPNNPDSDILQSLTKSFLESLAEKNFSAATARFDETMLKVMPAEKLAATWQGVINSVGDYQSLTNYRHASSGDYDIIIADCKFAKKPLGVKVVFDKEQRIAGLFFIPAGTAKNYTPPAYADQTSFAESPVTVGSTLWRLPGTLTIPNGPGKFPAVVLVHGSGPQDRDQTIGPNKPFKDLAWGLGSKGVIVLRYDKRTKTHRAKLLESKEPLTVKQETIDDALQAVVRLRQHPSVDKTRIVIAGHSLGGYLIPRFNARDKKQTIAGYISLAGTTRTLEDLLIDQTTYILNLDGSLSDADQEHLTQLQTEVARVKNIDLTNKQDISPILGVPSSYWIDLHGYRPAHLARKITKPLLFLQGERDYQVTMADFQNWQESLVEKEYVHLKTYPQLNHLFIPGNGKSTPAEYETAGNVSSQVIEDIAAWIDQL